MAETIFSKILRGEVPCHKLYEDAQVLAFLDIAPLSPGHAVVIPKDTVRLRDEGGDGSVARCRAFAERSRQRPASRLSTCCKTMDVLRTRPLITSISMSSPSQTTRKGWASNGQPASSIPTPPWRWPKRCAGSCRVMPSE